MPSYKIDLEGEPLLNGIAEYLIEKGYLPEAIAVHGDHVVYRTATPFDSIIITELRWRDDVADVTEVEDEGEAA